jgi:hypothetical protein
LVSAEEGLLALLLSGAGPVAEVESTEVLTGSELPQPVISAIPRRRTIKSREAVAILFIKRILETLPKNYASISIVMYG